MLSICVNVSTCLQYTLKHVYQNTNILLLFMVEKFLQISFLFDFVTTSVFWQKITNLLFHEYSDMAKLIHS